jgi:hypothetical protein
MNYRLKLKSLAAGALVCAALKPAPLLACAACYGASDSPLAKGMNWGIFSLLGVVVVVLSSIATFFVFLAKKAANFPDGLPAAPASEPDQQA